MMQRTVDVVIAGAGVSGLSAALAAARLGAKSILIADPCPILSGTSSASTEGWRECGWGSEAVSGLVQDSVARMREDGVELGSQGYLWAYEGEEGGGMGGEVGDFGYLGEEVSGVDFCNAAGFLTASSVGMNALELAREHATVEVVREEVEAVDAVGGQIRGVFIGGEFVETGAFLNCAGPWARYVHERICTSQEALDLVRGGEESEWVVTAGTLPLFNELHGKVLFSDVAGVVPRDGPMVIAASSPQRHQLLDHEEAEMAQAMLGCVVDLGKKGAHLRPLGMGEVVLMLWDAWHEHVVIDTSLVLLGKGEGGGEGRGDGEVVGVRVDSPPSPHMPNFPLDSQLYPEVVLRALTPIVPGLQTYLSPDSRALLAPTVKDIDVSLPVTPFPQPIVDGGCYTRTPENEPCLGLTPAPSHAPLPPQTTTSTLPTLPTLPTRLPTPFTAPTHVLKGVGTAAGLSGFGIMAARAAGHVAAIAALQHNTAHPLLQATRFQDPNHQTRRKKMLETDSGQI